MYEKIDKEGAKIIDKNNKRRLIRAIEVCLSTKSRSSKKEKENSCSMSRDRNQG